MYLGSVLPFHDELVLKQDEIPLTLLVFHQCLELGTESVEKVSSTRGDFV